MSKYFDENTWKEYFKKPTWYFEIFEEYKKLLQKAEDKTVNDEIKEDVYSFVEQCLNNKEINLSETGPNWDEKRLPIDTIVIHHSKNKPGLSWKRLNAIHLLRLYATYYNSPYLKEDERIKGQGIFSNHFRDDFQVFYAYHWLIRNDGTSERLLRDDQIGWHAGNWITNCRSIAICIDDNIEEKIPSDIVLASIANIIKEKYPFVSPQRIFGHCEINNKTICPGNKFLSDWKDVLIKQYKELQKNNE